MCSLARETRDSVVADVGDGHRFADLLAAADYRQCVFHAVGRARELERVVACGEVGRVTDRGQVVEQEALRRVLRAVSYTHLNG